MNGRRASAGGRKRPRHEPMRPPPLVRRSDGRTVPRPSPGPKQERPDAGRSPGSRVVARHTAFPDLGRYGVGPVAAPSKRGRDVRLARRLQLQGQPRLRESISHTVFPIKSLSGHQRDHCPARYSSSYTRSAYPWHRQSARLLRAALSQCDRHCRTTTPHYVLKCQSNGISRHWINSQFTIGYENGQSVACFYVDECVSVGRVGKSANDRHNRPEPYCCSPGTGQKRLRRRSVISASLSGQTAKPKAASSRGRSPDRRRNFLLLRR